MKSPPNCHPSQDQRTSRLQLFQFLSLIAGLLFSGCVGGLGPRAIRQEHANYNQQIVSTVNEQMLLNLVRLRYNDTPLFLEVGTVVAQYSLDGGLSASGAIGLNPGPGSQSVGLGGSTHWSERPTVTLTPLQGSQFATQMLSPIPTDTLTLLSQSGWSIERLMQVAVQRINDVGNSPTATGPTPEEPPRYQQMADLASRLRRLQKAGLWAISSLQTNRAPLFWFRPPNDPDSPFVEDIAAARRLLDLPTDLNEFPISSFPYKRRPNEIGLRGRTMLGVLYYLSQAVEPPPAHFKARVATQTRLPDGEPFDWKNVTGNLLKIHSSESRPENAFLAIKHRGYWFHIADDDRESKITFNLLNLLFSLQAASSQGKSPMLTLPIGQ